MTKNQQRLQRLLTLIFTTLIITSALIGGPRLMFLTVAGCTVGALAMWRIIH